jgi:cell division protein FtsQ
VTKTNSDQRVNRKNRNKNGALRSSSIPWKKWLSGLLAFSVLGLMGWSIFRLEPLAIIEKYTNKPIAQVSIQGEFKYVSQASVENLIATELTETFLELDIVALKKHLERHPWIDRAVVTRLWPDTLLIKVFEQQPIARWNNDDFLNFRGEIVNLGNKTQLHNLPLLKADDRYADRVMQQFVLVAKLLSNYKFAPLVLELDNTLAWTLTISPGMSIKLGRDDTTTKLKRLLEVFAEDLSSEIVNIDSVDMRYRQGFAIAWKTPSNKDFSSVEEVLNNN